jgi:hypothetical protein
MYYSLFYHQHLIIQRNEFQEVERQFGKSKLTFLPDCLIIASVMVSEEARKISEALIRIAAYIRTNSLRAKTEEAAIDLLGAVLLRDERQSLMIIESIRGFLSLGEQICEIEPSNVSFLSKKLNWLDSAIRQDNLGRYEKVDTRRIFSSEKDETVFNNSENSQVTADSATSQSNSESSSEETEGSNPAIRQERIAGFIRQVADGKAQMKDIAAALSEVSERTIRYDLEKLVQKGIVKRVGDSGPNTHYVIK